MTEQQAAKIIELLEGIKNSIDGLCAVKRTWNPEKKDYDNNPDYRSLNVEVMNEVEVTGSVTAYGPR